MNDMLEIKTNKIKAIEDEEKESRFSIAWILKEIYDKKIYKIKYKNIVEYSENELQYKKAYTYILLKIANEYMDDGVPLIKGFSVSQIQELLLLPDDIAFYLLTNKIVTSDMTTKEIREIVKKYKKP